MKKLVLITILLIFSVSQGVAGALDIGQIENHGKVGAIYTGIDHEISSDAMMPGATHDKKCCEKHPSSDGANTSHCQADCQLYFSENISFKGSPPFVHDLGRLSLLTSVAFKACLRPPIS